MLKKISVIINPASGIPRPILPVLNSIFRKEGAQWDVSILNRFPDAQGYVQEAAERNVDAIAVYGGDGTINAVASCLVGKQIPLMILPGGSGNVLAAELGVPSDLARACQLCRAGQYKIRTIDIGRANDQYFFLRVSLGFEAELVKKADKIKTYIGRLAYALSGSKALLDLRPTGYEINLDGHKVQAEGLSCVIANSGNLGLPGFSLSPKIIVDDGLLDVLLIRSADLKSLFSFDIQAKWKANFIRDFFQHWKAKEVSIAFDGSQSVHCDGEIWEPQPIKAMIVPKAVQVVVPKKDNLFMRARQIMSRKNL